MSWSEHAAGPPASVVEKIEGWGERVASVDCARGATAVVAQGHQRQIANAVEAIKAFADRAPAGYHVTVSANGHHNGEDADNCNVNMGYYNPVPIAAAGFQP